MAASPAVLRMRLTTHELFVLKRIDQSLGFFDQEADWPRAQTAAKLVKMGLATLFAKETRGFVPYTYRYRGRSGWRPQHRVVAEYRITDLGQSVLEAQPIPPNPGIRLL